MEWLMFFQIGVTSIVFGSWRSEHNAGLAMFFLLYTIHDIIRNPK